MRAAVRLSLVATYSVSGSPRQRSPQIPGSAFCRRVDSRSLGNGPRPGEILGLITYGPAAVREGRMHVLYVDSFDEDVDHAAAASEMNCGSLRLLRQGPTRLP